LSKDVATDLSGRGIGMGALLAAVSDLGGTIDLESVPGFGTCLRIAFPNDRVDSLSPAA
jgi:chemotaxis protein histidine kinase CheA